MEFSIFGKSQFKRERIAKKYWLKNFPGSSLCYDCILFYAIVSYRNGHFKINSIDEIIRIVRQKKQQALTQVIRDVRNRRGLHPDNYKRRAHLVKTLLQLKETANFNHSRRVKDYS